MKRYLFIILAALGLAGCTEKLAGSGSSSQKGELERSYISVTLKSDDASTRADDSFEYGESAERYVENVHFFFFKSDGTAFPVNAAGGKNYLSFNVNSNGTQPGETGNPNEGPNVSDVKDKILVFDNYKGEYPSYIVAVLNWDSRHLQPSYTLDNLYNTLAGIRNSSDHFVMSTSVYADMHGQVIKANPLTINNIGKTEAQAKANPVEIYVERISAKVQVEAKGDVAGKEATYDVDQSVGDVAVYAKVLKWELYNEYHQSIILKHIYPETWGMAGQIGFLWNDPNRFRSYWAGSYTGAFPDDNRFNWSENGLEPGTGVAYCGENTRQAEMDAEGKVIKDPRTKVIIKAQLVAEDGTPVEVANWYGHNYIGEESVRAEISKLLASQIFYMDGTVYRSIGGSDLKALPGNSTTVGVEAYEVYFQLSDSGLEKDWFIYSNAGGYTNASDEQINAMLFNVEPALVYNDGMTYYFTEIKHLGKPESTTEFGIVRNHVYNVNITKIDGFGTPVYDPEIDIDTPERPLDTKSYVAAEVRILSWKVVKNDYSVE